MIRLFKMLVSCVLLCVFAWFAVTVRVGKYTLWEHARRIASTSEAQDLAQGTKSKAKEMARDFCERVNCEKNLPAR